MFGGASRKLDVADTPRERQHQQPHPSAGFGNAWEYAATLAVHAQHQHGPPFLTHVGAMAGSAAAWAAARHEEWQREVVQSSSPGRPWCFHLPTSTVDPAAAAVHENRRERKMDRANGEGNSKSIRRKVGQMGTGALSNTVGVWTSSGIPVSKSRASKVDETVDVGAQANPSGVYPIVQPMAYLPRQQQSPHISGRNCGSNSQTYKKNPGASHTIANISSTTTKPVHCFGPCGANLDGRMYPRPFSAPASVFSESMIGPISCPGVGAVKRPLPPSPGEGLGRLSGASARGKGASAGSGAGTSKAAQRAAARAAAAASVISAVADSRKSETRAVAAAAAAVAAAAASGVSAARSSRTAHTKTSVPQTGDRTRRGQTLPGTPGGEEVDATQPRRPATAPASSAAATAGTEYSRSNWPDRDQWHHHYNHFPLPPPSHYPHCSAVGNSYPITPWGPGLSIPLPMPFPMPMSFTHQQWSRHGRPLTSSENTMWQSKTHRSRGGASSLAEAPKTVPMVAAAVAVANASPNVANTKTCQEMPLEKVEAPKPEQEVKSSPHCEDTYADSWLAGMPWASSLPPEVDSLEVEVAGDPAPLDALRSDDRGTRDDDDGNVIDEEGPVLFMNHQAPTDPLEKKTEVDDNTYDNDRDPGVHSPLGAERNAAGSASLSDESTGAFRDSEELLHTCDGMSTTGTSMGAGTNSGFPSSSSSSSMFSLFDVGRRSVGGSDDSASFPGSVRDTSTSLANCEPQGSTGPDLESGQSSPSQVEVTSGTHDKTAARASDLSQPSSSPTTTTTAPLPPEAAAAATHPTDTAELESAEEVKLLATGTALAIAPISSTGSTSQNALAQQPQSLLRPSFNSAAVPPNADPGALQQSFPTTTTTTDMSLPNWAHHPPALPDFNLTSSPLSGTPPSGFRDGASPRTTKPAQCNDAVARKAIPKALPRIARPECHIGTLARPGETSDASTATTIATNPTGTASSRQACEIATAITQAPTLTAGTVKVVGRAEAAQAGETSPKPCITIGLTVADVASSGTPNSASSDIWPWGLPAAQTCTTNICTKPTDYEEGRNSKRLKGIGTAAAGCAAVAPESGVGMGWRAATFYEAEEEIQRSTAFNPAGSGKGALPDYRSTYSRRPDHATEDVHKRTAPRCSDNDRQGSKRRLSSGSGNVPP